MTNKEKIDFIDDFLAHEENYCHGEEGESCSLSRKYLRELEKQLTSTDVSKRFIIEVFLNNRRLEYRASKNENELRKELEILKQTYKSRDCVFYFGSLNAC